jgi:hypothetical protein
MSFADLRRLCPEAHDTAVHQSFRGLALAAFGSVILALRAVPFEEEEGGQRGVEIIRVIGGRVRSSDGASIGTRFSELRRRFGRVLSVAACDGRAAGAYFARSPFYYGARDCSVNGYSEYSQELDSLLLTVIEISGHHE